MDEELKGIVQRMIDAGESEANIASVIQTWNSQKKTSNQNEVSGQDSASGAPTSTEPLRNFQAPDIPEIGVQNLGANLTQPATFGDITQAADQRLTEQEAVQATVQQQMPYLQEDPTRGAIPTPLTPEGQQEYVQDTLIPHIEQQEQQVQDFNRNLQNIREQNRAAGYFTDQDRIKFREQAIERIQNDMATQSKNAGFLSRNIIQPASNFSQGFTQGVANIGTGIIGLPEFANDIVASAMNGIIELAGGPEGAVPTWDETYGNTPLDQINSFVSEATQRQRDLLEKKYGEGGTWEQIKKGNINGAINLIANGVGETAPIMALYAMTGGAGAGAQVAGGTALFGSQTYQDLGESDVPTELKLANSLVGGLAEGFFETVGTGWLFNTARKVLRTAGKEQAESFLKDSIEKTLKRAYEKYYVVTAPAGEILTEGATLVTQNFMDQITGVDPERGLLDGWQDTAILAAAASTPISTPTAAIRSIRDKKARKEAEGLLEYNNGIIEALQNEDVNVEEKAALFERYQNNTQKINQYLDQEQEWRGNLTDRQRAMVEEVEQRQSEIETLMQNESLPDAARAGLEQEQSDLDAQMDEIVEETQKLPDSSDFSPETQDRIRDMTARIDEINSEIRRMRNEGTLTPDVEAPLVLERRRIQDEINELEPDAQTETTVETPTDETITETVEETPTEPVEATDTATKEVVAEPIQEGTPEQGQTNLEEQPVTDPSQAVQVVDESEAESGQYFTRDISGEQTVYRRNEDGTASIVPDTEAQNILSQQDVTPTESTAEQTTIEPAVEPVVETTTEQVQEAVPETAIRATQAPVSLDPNTVSMPVSQITTDEASFQNREGLDQGRVNDIVENFDEAKLDPIVVYNDNGKTVVLSGHHRLAAAQQMGMENIPARIFEGTREEATDFARDSNTLSRQETIPERAKRYAQLRADGVPESQIQEMARVAHGNQAIQVLNISRLDPKGKTIEAINSFEDSTDADTKNKVTAIGDWIGNAKKRHPDLSRQQENEMFDYLMESYSTKKGAGRITSRSQFADVASSLVDRLKSQGSFGPSSRLNFKNAAGKSSIQLEYDARLADARQAESDARKALDDKRKEVVARGLSVDQQDRVLRPLEENLRIAIRDLSEVRGLKGQVEQANRQQTSLFDDIHDSNTDQYGNTSEQIETILSEETGTRKESTDTASEQSEQKAAPPTEAPRQVDEATETTQPEAPKKPAAKKPKKAPSFKEILTSPEARQERSNELIDRIRKYRESQQGQGIAKDSKAEAKYWRDVTDYAIIRLVDGAITSVNQLAQELGLKPDKRLKQAFNDARAEIGSDPDLATTTGRNLDTAKKRRNYGFDERLPVEREPTADVMAKAKEELQNGYPIEDLFARIEGGAGATSLETAILMQYSAAQEAEVLRQGDEIERTRGSRFAVVNEHIDARERALNNLLRSYNALEQSGTVNARAMNIRKQLVQWDFSLAGMIAQRRKAIGYDSVSPQQMQEIEQEFRRMQDVIDKIRDRNDLLEQEMTRLEAENAILKVKKEHAEKQGGRKKPRTEQIQDIRERRKAALDDIRDIWAEITSPGFAYDPKEDASRSARLTKAILNLARTYLEEGITNAGEIVDKIHSAVSSVAPGITRQQVTAAIAGTDRESRPQLSDIQRAMRDLRLELRLLEDIERLEKGADRVREPRAKEIRNARIEDLRARLRELRQSQREQGSKEEKDLSKAKKATHDRIKEYQRRINEKDYAPKVPNLIEEDAELKALRKELKKIRFDFQVESKKFELQRRAKWKKGMDLAIDILNVPRALMATADLSAPLRQGIFVLASRPILSAKAFVSMLQFARSKQTYEDYMLDFIESPGYDLAMKAGLSITDVSSNPEVTAREEQFMSNIASRILKNVPVLGETKRVEVKGNKIKIPGLDVHGGAERAYNGYLNKLRIDMFERGVEQLQNAGYSTDQNPGAYKELAKYINAATGRGPLNDSLKLSAAALSSIFFSPRLIASRLYLLAGGPLYTAPAPVRKMYIQDAVSFVAFGLGVLALGSILGDADSEDDPRSSDFGKMRFGDDRYDIWGGFTQYITFLSRMFTGERVTSTGRVRKLDGSEYDKMTRGDLAMRFIRSKLSPTAAFITSALQNSNYMGEPFDVVDELTNMSYPLVAQDIVEAWEAKGSTAALAPGLPIILGVGFQSYGANDFLQKGVDGAMIDLLNDKKVATITPKMQGVKVYEAGEGERKLTGEEYKRYTKYWSDYIKADLTNNRAEYQKMGPNTFDKKYQAVKAAATKYAKQQITGVSSDDLRIQSQGKTFKLTPEQVEIRIDLMNKYKDRYGHRIYRDRDKYKRQGMSDETALMQAKKDFASEARSDSRDKMLQMQRRGEIQLTEGLED